MQRFVRATISVAKTGKVLVQQQSGGTICFLFSFNIGGYACLIGRKHKLSVKTLNFQEKFFTQFAGSGSHLLSGMV